ncbi:hypothetical protein [Pontibacter beigongshangensis]|uniref:hypothetical protein n=1 Tax=Pontibacter beigongshangensis TaxID=2574733 RepID=UPI00164F0E51|nr:hypothetical protein [Pontibacter beigongshangensis]
MPNLPYPTTVKLFESKLRIFKDTLYILDLELRRLEVQLKHRDIDQFVYDDAVAAIENDKQHLCSEITKLTELKPSYLKTEAA